MNPPLPKILDVTIRDGSYLINHQYTPEIVSQIARGLSQAGVEYAEVSHGCGIGGKLMGYPSRTDDEELMSAAKQAAPNLKISAFIPASDLSLSLIPGLVEYFEMGRVGVNVDEVKTAEKVIKKLKRYQKIVSLQLVRCHARSAEFAGVAAKTASELGVDIIYVVDTFGSFLPNDVENYISAIKSETQALIGFHGHNHIGMAIPNTLTAWKAGATWLDASLMGVGRDAGNTNLEILATLLELHGVPTGIHLKKLCDVTQSHVQPIFKLPPHSRYLDLLCSEYEVDFTPSELLELASHYLHVPLEQLILQLKAKMKECVALSQVHLKEVFKEHSQDFDVWFSHLKEPQHR